MSTPAIQYSGPVVSESVPWEIRRHIQLLYQKSDNHTQAFSLQQKQISEIKAGSTTSTTTFVQGNSSSGSSSVFIGQGYINDQSGQVAYTVTQGDNGILLILNDPSPVAVSLTTYAAPFYLIIANFGAGTATLTPSTGTINGGASIALRQNQTVIAASNSTNWETTAYSVAPANTPAIAHEWLYSYDATTGLFGQSQPAFSDISGVAAPGQLPVATLTSFGAVEPDGTTIAITAGVIRVAVPPLNTPAVAHEWVTGYNAATGAFGQTQPDFSDISGQISTSQLPSSGITVTIVTAALTGGGTQGSMSFTNGILTAQVQAT